MGKSIYNDFYDKSHQSIKLSRNTVLNQWSFDDSYNDKGVQISGVDLSKYNERMFN